MPARAAFWTGRHPHETGVPDNGRTRRIPDSMPTLGTLLTVAEVESAEAFEDSTRRPCVAVVVRSGGKIVAATNFLADEDVLVVE